MTPAAPPSYTGAVARRLLMVVGLAVAVASPGGAEHRLDTRFVVLGYVTDARGRPLRGQAIELIREKTGFSYLDETDDTGLYVIIARLGDESAGEHLRLRMGKVVTIITARFDPGDHDTDRGTRVDLVGGKPVERAAWFASTLRKFLTSR